MRKIVLNSDSYIINKKGFSTIEFVLIFPCKYNKDYIAYIPLLIQLLKTTTKKYNTERKYRNAYKKLLIISKSINYIKYNDDLFIEFRFIIPDPKKVKIFNIEEALEFFIDSIYNPNVINNEFNKKCFNREKRFIELDINNSLKNVYTKAYQSFINIVDDTGYLKDNIYNNLDLLKKANSKNLYKVYEEYILNNNPISFIYGDIDDSMSNLFVKYLNNNKGKITINLSNNKYFIPFEKMKDIEEEFNYNESILYMAYKVKNMSSKDEIILSLIKDILGTSPNNLIFKKLRQEKKLVYSCSTWISKTLGLLVIESYINNSSKDKIIDSVKEVLDSLKNKQLLSSYIEKLIKDMEYDLIASKDSRVKKLNDFIIKKTKINYTLEELIYKYKTIDLDTIIKFLDRLTLDTLYFLRGDMSE